MSNCCNANNKKPKIDITNLDGLICYCFKHSKRSLFTAVKNQTEDLIIEDIKTKMKEPGCFCETANPSGKCCLSDVMDFVEAVKKI